MSSSNKTAPLKAPTKQVGQFIKIRGTKTSYHNAQLLISTGVPSLDHLCGGGVPVGTVFLIEEDTYSRYSKLLLKYYLAEGAVCGHDLLVASGTSLPGDIIKELPGLVQESTNQVTSNSMEASDKMKIAWRYQKQDSYKSPLNNSSFGHTYDLSKSLDANIVNNVQITEFDAMKQFQINNAKNSDVLENLLATIKETIDSKGFKPSLDNSDLNIEKNVLRIGISSLGSPLWCKESPEDLLNSLPLFLLRLKALMRASFAVSFVSVPFELLNNFEENGCIRKLEGIADNIIHLESFMGSKKEKNPLYKDYHGLFHVKKFARINSLCCHTPSAFDLAFKIKKKSFAIEVLHLPPDLSETVNRSQASTPAQSCSAATSQGLDF